MHIHIYIYTQTYIVVEYLFMHYELRRYNIAMTIVLATRFSREKPD